MPETPTPTPELQNATADVATGFASSEHLVGPMLLILIYAVGALGAAQYLAPHLAQSRLLERAGKRVTAVVVFALKGAAASAVLAVVALPAYLLLTVDGETRGVALEYLWLAAVAFVALACIGWLADRAVTAYIDAHPDHEEWADLFPEEESEAVADGGETDG